MRAFHPILPCCLALASAAIAATYPVEWSNFIPRHDDDLPKNIEIGMANPGNGTFVPLPDTTGEKLSAAIHCCPLYAMFYLRASGIARCPAVDDAGGSVHILLLEGADNSEKNGMPIGYRYDMTPWAPPPPLVPLVAASSETTALRNPFQRLVPDTPAYGGLRNRRCTPSVVFVPQKDGWLLVFRFPWSQLRERLPFQYGKFSQNWRLILERTAPDGRTSSWGTLAEPAVLSWPRGGDALVEKMRRALVYPGRIGPDARPHYTFVDTKWTTYLTERHIGFFDPGVETFEPKNSASDDCFYTNCVKKIIDAGKNLDEAIFWDPLKGPAFPKAHSMPKAYMDEVVDELDRAAFLEDLVEEARRDYLLDRFLDRPVREPAALAEYRAKQAKKPKLRPAAQKGAKFGDISMDDLSDQDFQGGGGLDLDDVSF